MPGVVATVAAQAGKPVRAGDLLLTIEAMKMETGIHADRDGTVKAVHVRPARRSTPRTSRGDRLSRPRPAFEDGRAAARSAAGRS
jgi:multidrug resistance efflux pump